MLTAERAKEIKKERKKTAIFQRRKFRNGVGVDKLMEVSVINIMPLVTQPLKGLHICALFAKNKILSTII